MVARKIVWIVIAVTLNVLALIGMIVFYMPISIAEGVGALASGLVLAALASNMYILAMRRFEHSKKLYIWLDHGFSTVLGLTGIIGTFLVTPGWERPTSLTFLLTFAGWMFLSRLGGHSFQTHSIYREPDKPV